MRKMIGLIALITALGVLSAAVSGASATEPIPTSPEGPSTESAASEAAPAPEMEALDVGCFANTVCIYNGEYSSFLGVFECSQSGVVWYSYGGHIGSARNRCGNKTAWLRYQGTAVRCLNPGNDAPHPPYANEVWIAQQYGAFC
jgi:hypothetical protein